MFLQEAALAATVIIGVYVEGIIVQQITREASALQACLRPFPVLLGRKNFVVAMILRLQHLDVGAGVLLLVPIERVPLRAERAIGLGIAIAPAAIGPIPG